LVCGEVVDIGNGFVGLEGGGDFLSYLSQLGHDRGEFVVVLLGEDVDVISQSGHALFESLQLDEGARGVRLDGLLQDLE